ncbi:MAG: DUF116 domain-containing protein [Deltaproteobacteria bacterium]|nr:DUF116 domain-containing protein [Deltaproteobacteria bacterium]
MAKNKSLIDKEAEWAGSAESIPYRPAKGIFIGLLAFCAFIVLVAGFLFWYIPSVGLGNIHPKLPLIFGIAVLSAIIFLVVGAFALTIAVANGKDIFHSYKFRGILIKFFLPLMIMLGGLLKIPKIKIEQSFIEINNQLVRGMGKLVKPEKIMILMPHCIQYVDCKIKVTQDIRNCKECGKCEIKDLLGIMDEYGIDIYISTGGTIARRKVYEKRPDVIVAVACERDLTSGIQDAYPLPVLGIVNKRPQGYCVGTGVDIGMVRDAISGLLYIAS